MGVPGADAAISSVKGVDAVICSVEGVDAVISSVEGVDAGASPVKGVVDAATTPANRVREFFIDNLLVRVHFIIVMIRWTGLAPWEFEFPFPGSLTSTFRRTGYDADRQGSLQPEEAGAVCGDVRPPGARQGRRCRRCVTPRRKGPKTKTVRTITSCHVQG